MSDGVDRVSQYVGEIEGSFHERWFYSQRLDRDMPYYIYLPPDYGTAGRRYPVLYMLHGGGGDRAEWVVYGLIDITDQQIRTGNIAPIIIVLPQGDQGWWTNHANNGPKWGDYDHYWTPYPGTHNGQYWVDHVLDYVRFYTNALSRH